MEFEVENYYNERRGACRHGHMIGETKYDSTGAIKWEKLISLQKEYCNIVI